MAAKPVVGSPEWKNSYPCGKYENAGYHPDQKDLLKNSNVPVKSPCPKNGQECLNNSYAVNGSMERVAMEDGKIVILKKTSDGIYHGYIVDDFHSIKNESVQKALVENGLIRTIKSGKVVKK